MATTGTVSSGNLVLNGTTDEFGVTFDRPMQAATFTPSDILQIMGPAGPISGPQNFPTTAVDQAIPKAMPTVPGMVTQTVTVPDYNGTFTIADITVSLDITDANDGNLSAELIAPDGTVVALFSDVGKNGQNFTSTVLDSGPPRRSRAARRRLRGRISLPVSWQDLSERTRAVHGRCKS